MQQILFVDDDPSILDGLRRLLRPMRNEWAMEFVDSGSAALHVLADRKIDVVVADMRMPVMDGAQLLHLVREKWPSVARIILSGYADQASAVRSVGVAHQFLAKPCDGALLKAVVQRTCALRNAMISDELKLLLTELGQLPAVPELYAALNRALADPDSSLVSIGKLVAKDFGMSAKILQLVNSAFFGLRRRVGSIDEAVAKIGTDVVRSLVLSSTAFTTFTDKNTVAAAEGLWQHSMRVAGVAAAISAGHSKNRADPENCFQAGMLHDVGKLVMMHKRPDLAELTEPQHGAIGAYLLALWGLEDPVVEAVAFHHHAGLAPPDGLSPLIAVHLADHLVHTDDGRPERCPIDESLLERPDIRLQLPAWLATGLASMEKA
jgi:putative nucleotidyltransferase with HDIG domain